MTITSRHTGLRNTNNKLECYFGLFADQTRDMHTPWSPPARVITPRNYQWSGHLNRNGDFKQQTVELVYILEASFNLLEFLRILVWILKVGGSVKATN